MRYLLWIGGLFLLLILAYFLGPRQHAPELNVSPLKLSESPVELETKINKLELAIPTLKPDNNARIIWADTSKKVKTPYCIVYLHGFSASYAEGQPVHSNIANRFGYNLFLPRLYAHGLQEKEPLLELTAEKLVESARYAVAVGKQLGDSVILMSSSTGGTLSLILSAEDPLIAGLIMYSPNIDLYDSKSFLLLQPWGLQIARAVVGSDYYTFKASEAAQQYWNTKYRIEALLQLKALLQETMNKRTFERIHEPVFVSYYFKDESHQDDVISVPALLNMYQELGTIPARKRKVDFPEAGIHCIASCYWTKDTRPVEDSTVKFLEEVMHLSPTQK